MFLIFRLSMKRRDKVIVTGLCILSACVLYRSTYDGIHPTKDHTVSGSEDAVLSKRTEGGYRDISLGGFVKDKTWSSDQSLFRYRVSSMNMSSPHTKPVLAIGIFSREKSLDKRKSLRETWLSQIRFAPFDIKYKFILDRPTKATEEEQKAYGDILYTNLPAEISGTAVCLSTRMLIWFNYVVSTFPNAELIAKMDDDVYACFPNLFERVYSVMSKKLYYGWKHGGNNPTISSDTRVDEMFVVVGRELVDKILTRKYCGCFADKALAEPCNKRKSKDELISHGNADIALGDWLAAYNGDVDRASDNSYMRHFSALFKDRMDNHKYAVPEFCLKNYIFHKSSTNLMYKLYYYNMYFMMRQESSSLLQNSLNYSLANPLTLNAIADGKPVSKKDTFCKYWVVTRAEKKYYTSFLNNWLNFLKIPSMNLLNSLVSRNWCVVIIGDNDTMDERDFRMVLGSDNKYVYLAPEVHEVHFPTLSDALFWDHVGRRNIGFAYAIHHGAEFVLDFYHDEVSAECVKNILNNFQEEKHSKEYLIQNCTNRLWSCSTFRFMALPIAVEPKYINTYRSVIAEFYKNAIGQFKADIAGDFQSDTESNLRNALMEIPTLLNDHDTEGVYLHLYRKGLMKYEDVAFSKIWIQTITTNNNCSMKL